MVPIKFLNHDNDAGASQHLAADILVKHRVIDQHSTDSIFVVP